MASITLPASKLILSNGMYKQEFIEKAIKGGWQIPMLLHFPENNDGQMNVLLNSVSDILLDPLAWQAVGKVEGWKVSNFDCTNFEPQEHHDYGNCDSCVAGQAHWLNNMHRLIDALAEASQKPNFNTQKTIEEYLSTL